MSVHRRARAQARSQHAPGTLSAVLTRSVRSSVSRAPNPYPSLFHVLHLDCLRPYPPSPRAALGRRCSSGSRRRRPGALRPRSPLPSRLWFAFRPLPAPRSGILGIRLEANLASGLIGQPEQQHQQQTLTPTNTNTNSGADDSIVNDFFEGRGSFGMRDEIPTRKEHPHLLFGLIRSQRGNPRHRHGLASCGNDAHARCAGDAGPGVAARCCGWGIAAPRLGAPRYGEHPSVYTRTSCTEVP